MSVSCLCAYLCVPLSQSAKNSVLVREAMVEPTLNGRSTSVLCSISSQCVIARVDMCSVQITEKWLRLWQRETALTDWPWCSSTSDMSASFSGNLSLSLWESAPFKYLYVRQSQRGRWWASRGSSSGWKLPGCIAIIRPGSEKLI